MKIRLVLFSLILAAATVAGADDEVHFALTGITPYETARLTGFCTGHMVGSGETTRVPDPCDVTLLFHDTLTGRVLKQEEMSLAPGTGRFLDLQVQTTARRVEIIPCVRVRSGGVFPSFEVFDNLTTRTRLLANWGDRSVPRSGDVDFGLARGSRPSSARASSRSARP